MVTSRLIGPTPSPIPTQRRRQPSPAPKRRRLGRHSFRPATARSKFAGDWKQIGEQSPSNAQVAWLTGYSPSSSSYANPRSALKTAGLIEYPSPDHVAITDVGEAQSIPIELQSSLLDFVVANLPGPEGPILKAIAAHYPNAVPNEPGRGRSSA